MLVNVVTEVEIDEPVAEFVATNSGPCCLAFQYELALMTSSLWAALGQLMTSELFSIFGVKIYHISVRPQLSALGSQVAPESIAPAFVKGTLSYVMLLTSQLVAPGFPPRL